MFNPYLCALALFLAAPVAVAQNLAPPSSVVPPLRPNGDVVAATRNAPADLGFPAWIESFRKRALAEGIAPATYDRVVRGLRYDPDVVALDSRQPEFTRQIWDYLDRAVSEDRVANGRAALAEHADLLAGIEARYGVEAEVVAAVWGMESAYGAFRGSTPILQALASLAYDGRRARFFESQLIAALKIVQAGDVEPGAMLGSWAGAMGHTQFMPGSYLEYAVDFTGDGKRDIWSDDPADALASTAAYLQRFGWTRGQPWGIEVTLPEGFDYALAAGRQTKPVSVWSGLGLRAADGSALPEHGPAAVLLPAGHLGVAFLVFGNFRVLERYNAADAYVIGVGHLSDRLAGGAPLRGSWPRGDRALSFDERQELQRLLLARGFDPNGVDGIVGPGTIAAVRAFQTSAGLVPDGYASLDLLKRLR